MSSCRTIRPELGAYLDGELRGTDMLRVSQHLETCAECAAQVAADGSIGGLVRQDAVAPVPTEFDGLASGVISRMRAEAEHSWSGVAERAVSDWHWAIVGVGAVTATVVSTVALSVLLALGPGPERPESLAALMADLARPSGFLFVAESTDGDPVASFQIDSGEPIAGGVVAALAERSLDQQATQAALVSQLADVMVRDGLVVQFDALSDAEQARAETLMAGIRRRPQMASAPTFTVRTVRRVMLDSVVTANGS